VNINTLFPIPNLFFEEESKEKEIYKEKDSILWNLEMGMLKHYNGAYEESNMYFLDAEIAIEQAFTKSVSRGIYAFLGSL